MKRILLIEDDVSQRQLFKTALQQAGYEVLEAADGQAGLQIYRQTPCDVIITDLFMPNTDGLETIFDLKAQPPQVKIIAISGGGSWASHGETFGADEPLEMAARFGADRTLKKPIKIRQLLEVIAELLERPEEPETHRATLLHDVAQKRILVIEDDAPQRRLFKTTLENAGYQVVEASDGREGLQRYQHQPCDLIITDIFMPQEDGIGTIFDLKAQHAPVKIIAISGGGKWSQYGSSFGADDPLEMAKRFGADRALKKPIKLQQLVALVDELLKVKGRLS